MSGDTPNLHIHTLTSITALHTQEHAKTKSLTVSSSSD